MGPSATWSALKSYWPIPLWALGFQLLSLAFAISLKAAGVIPAAFVPSFCFNNVTSLPLLLIESLSASGSLDGLAVGGESASKLLAKGRVYLLCVIEDALLRLRRSIPDDRSAHTQHQRPRLQHLALRFRTRPDVAVILPRVQLLAVD